MVLGNASGALARGVVTAVVVIKFPEGAWPAALPVPGLIGLYVGILLYRPGTVVTSVPYHQRRARRP